MASITRKSVCALDCPDTCALIVHIDEAGRAAKLTGDPRHPVTRGFLCGKVAQYLEREYHPDRILYPLRRTGRKGAAQFERVTWDRALDEIASRLQAISDETGPEAILPYSYAGTMGLLNGAGMDRRFFHRLGASRLDRTICSATGGEALTRTQGIKLGTDPEQFSQAKLIIAWGANVLGTNAHLWPFIVEARREGARFYVIDPVKNRTGRAADRHFAVHPGSDQALALGLIHVILRDSLQDQTYIDQHSDGFDQLAALARQYPPERVAYFTGIGGADIEVLAHDYATTRPAVIRLNYGVQRSERGGAAVSAIAALPVITGSWREAGGGLQLTTSGAFEFNRKDLERADLQLLSPLKREARVVNMVRLGHALTELDRPRIEALVVYNSNPAAIAPNQAKVIAGLQREDLFTVVLEQFMTDTARHADFVLPVTTFLEHTDLYLAYGHYYLQLARPALTAPGETRCNVEIFRALAKRMGFVDPGFDDSEDDMIRTLLDSGSEYLKGITLEDLDSQRSIRLKVANGGRPFLPFANGGFKTGSRKFEFGAASLDYQPPVESRHGSADLNALFPLEFVSPKNDDSMNSTFGHRDQVDRQTAWLTIHPADAAVRQVVSGDPVRVFNERGCCFLTARMSDEVQPGVVMSRSTRWNTRALRSLGVNRLTSDRLTDIGGGATFYSCLVEVVPTKADYGASSGLDNTAASTPK
jgi:anaerobic selenocysteine-containing dehydrogenase